MLMVNIGTSRSLTITEMFSLYPNNSCNSFSDKKKKLWKLDTFERCRREKNTQRFVLFQLKNSKLDWNAARCFFFLMLADVSTACVVMAHTVLKVFDFCYAWNISSSDSLLLMFPDDIFNSSRRKCWMILRYVPFST